MDSKKNIDKTKKKGVGVNGNLIPAKPGECRNPNGRPKKGYAIADILNARLDTEETREKVFNKVVSMALAGDKWAIEFIADRTEGKALERVQKQKVKDTIELL